MPGPFPSGEIPCCLGWCFGGAGVVGLDAFSGWVGLPLWCGVYIYIYIYIYICMCVFVYMYIYSIPFLF